MEVESRRYIFCFNVVQAQKEKRDRVEILKGLSSQLKRGGEKSLIGNKGYRRYIKIVGESGGNKSKGFEIDFEKVKSEARYDGKWVLRTNTNYDSAEVALKYKELWMVEQIFRTLKSLLETRPIYHSLDETIIGHVFCSFLALVLIKELQDRMNMKGYDFEWYDVLHDIDALEEVEIEKDGKRFVFLYCKTSVWEFLANGFCLATAPCTGKIFKTKNWYYIKYIFGQYYSEFLSLTMIIYYTYF